MPLIADLCPNCQRVTRCHVVERGSVTGGVILGVPFVLPTSSVTFYCGECGCEFMSQTWDYQKYLSPGEAMSLDIEAILSLTNPALKEQLALSKLKAVPELGGAFHLHEQLKPGVLRTALKGALLQWPCLDEGRRERFLADTNDCTEALRFARLMAGRSATGVVGCLVGALGCAGVWSGCVVAFGTQLSVWGWLGTYLIEVLPTIAATLRDKGEDALLGSKLRAARRSAGSASRFCPPRSSWPICSSACSCKARASRCKRPRTNGPASI